jgi:DNA-binding transcriptional LysR family regulator
MRQLDRFLEKHPELEIDMVLDDRPINLVEEGIDVAFRSGSLANSTLVARKLGQARRLVMATPNYSAKYGESKSPAELIAHQTAILHAGWRRRVLDVPPRLGRDFGGC